MDVFLDKYKTKQKANVKFKRVGTSSDFNKYYVNKDLSTSGRTKHKRSACRRD